MEQNEVIGTDIAITASDFNSLAIAYLVIGLYFSIRGAGAFRKKGKSAFKGAFLAILSVSLVFSLILLILATIK